MLKKPGVDKKKRNPQMRHFMICIVSSGGLWDKK